MLDPHELTSSVLIIVLKGHRDHRKNAFLRFARINWWWSVLILNSRLEIIRQLVFSPLTPFTKTKFWHQYVSLTHNFIVIFVADRFTLVKNKRINFYSTILSCNAVTGRSDHPTFRWYDDVIKLKHFPRYWPFVRGINWSPVNFPHKGQWRGALRFSLVCAWINGWGWWFETQSPPLWRHCNGIINFHQLLTNCSTESNLALYYNHKTNFQWNTFKCSSTEGLPFSSG